MLLPAAVAVTISREEDRNTFLHLGRSFVGESDGQDASRRDTKRLDEVGDPVSDDAGLAAACARQDQQRSFRLLDGCPLRWIEFLEKTVHSIRILLFPSGHGKSTGRPLSSPR